MSQRFQIVELAARYRLSAIYPWREFCEAGGLMSYGPDLLAAYLEAGRYTGRILKGAAPGDLPVQLPTKFDRQISEGARHSNFAPAQCASQQSD